MKILSSIVLVSSAFLLLPVSAKEEVKADRLPGLLDRCSDYYFGKFKITPYLEFAQALQTLTREEQAKKLLAWAEDPLNERKLHILCQMLFCEKDGSSVIGPTGLGVAAGTERFPSKPHFYGPVAIYENCPILICDGHRIAGMQVPSSHYLRTAIEKNLWREVSYSPLSDEKQSAIIAAFLKSETWSDLTVVYDNPAFFTNQVGNPSAVIDRELTLKEIIQQGHGNDAYKASAAMEEFLKTWNPIGHTTEELMAKFGEPSKKKTNSIIYKFDNGEFGWNFEFVYENDKITELKRPPSE